MISNYGNLLTINSCFNIYNGVELMVKLLHYVSQWFLVISTCSRCSKGSGFTGDHRGM